MKKSFPILVLLFCFLVVSCETESIDSMDTQKTNLTLESIDQISSNGTRGPLNCTSEENIFERQLHWLSFVAAEALFEDTLAQQEIASYLSSNITDNINAVDLIGPNSLPAFNHFSTTFHDILVAHLEPGYPGSGGDRPTVPPTHGGWPEGTPGELIASTYYGNLLVENCVELYFPNGVDFSHNFNITSSAHPLTWASCNEGYLLEKVPLFGGIVTSGIELTQGYVNTHDNVLIGRPFRQITPECLYLEYGGIDFPDFMD